MAGKANPRFEQALKFALKAHTAVHQERKGTDFPYLVHPVRVAAILDQFDCTTVIYAGQVAKVDEYKNLIVTSSSVSSPAKAGDPGAA